MPSQRNKDEACEDSAIVVGIAKYPNLGDLCAPNDLGGPVDDAIAVAGWLKDEAGVPSKRITCITSSGVHNVTKGTVRPWRAREERPRREDVEGPLYRMVRGSLLKRNSGPPRLGRRLWVYCAGHGYAPQNSTRDIALLVADALAQGYVPNLALTKFVDWVAQLQLFDEVVLWLDCCAEARPGIALGEPASQAISYAPTPAARFMLSAAQYSRLAYEDTSQTPPRGVFTSRLLGALRGGVPLSAGGYVTSEAVRDFFQNTPAPQTGNPAAMQRPRALECDPINLVHIGNGVSQGIPASAPLYTLKLSPPAGTPVRIYDHRLQQIAGQAIDANGAVSLALVAGVYKVEGPSGYRRLFQIVPGAPSDVSVG